MKTLILVDIQNDFTPQTAIKPQGNLAVPNGNEVVDVANKIMPHFDLVIATQDWHPANHQSFASQHPDYNVGDLIPLNKLDQILWPDHCIQNTYGAELCENLNRDLIHHIVYKGTDTQIDSYSGFFDNGQLKETELRDVLIQHNAKSIYIMGLATDYCVKFTALDAAQLGFDTHLILEGCRGVELQEGDCSNAIQEINTAGVEIIDKFDL
ncbi:bifunctional nicotinamidase/pyrazinamidase [Poriferisphaera sp. WC338]|uniref:bifunctional nicotinamidase/pyrazinamidase n=1 Tax=Poriferisphaera sp. WC338 TaxID=3425129 RepID=UPI003D81A355